MSKQDDNYFAAFTSAPTTTCTTDLSPAATSSTNLLSNPPPSQSPSITHMRTLAAAATAAAEESGRGGSENDGCGSNSNTILVEVGKKEGNNTLLPSYFNRPQSNKVLRSTNNSHPSSSIPTSITKSICSLAMQMVGDETIRARVAELIPDDFLMVEHPTTEAHHNSALGAAPSSFSIPPAMPTIDSDVISNNVDGEDDGLHSSSSPLFDDSSYSEWIAIQTPSTTDAAFLGFPSSTTPSPPLGEPSFVPAPTAGATTSDDGAFGDSRAAGTPPQLNSDALAVGKQPAPQTPPSQNPHNNSTRLRLRRNVSSLLEMSFSLQASPRCSRPSLSTLGETGEQTSQVQISPSSSSSPLHPRSSSHPQPQMTVLSMATSPPTRLLPYSSSSSSLSRRTGETRTPASISCSSPSSSSSSLDPDLLSSRVHSESSSSSTTPPPSPPLQSQPSSSTSPHHHRLTGSSGKGSGGSHSSWFESLFNAILSSLHDSNNNHTTATKDDDTDVSLPESTSRQQSPSSTVQPPALPPRTATTSSYQQQHNLIFERQFVIAAAYVLNAALVAGVQSADFILGQSTGNTSHDGSSGTGDTATTTHNQHTTSANRIIQSFVEAAVEVIQHAWFTAQR